MAVTREAVVDFLFIIGFVGATAEKKYLLAQAILTPGIQQSVKSAELKFLLKKEKHTDKQIQGFTVFGHL